MVETYKLYQMARKSKNGIFECPNRIYSKIANIDVMFMKLTPSKCHEISF